MDLITLESDYRKKKNSYELLESELQTLEVEIQAIKGKSKKVNVDVKGNPLPCEIYLDGYLKDNLDYLHKLVSKNWDNIGFICGYEGDGKTNLAKTIALAFDHKLKLEHIVFNPEQFFKAVDNAPPGSAIIWDEADDLGQQWYKDLLQALKAKMKRIRSRNLHIILVTPTIFDLNKYFAIGRTRWLIHVYADGDQRGYFRFFNRERKKELYLKGAKDWNWNAAQPNFIGRFTRLPEAFPINDEEYQNKKDRATEEVGEKGKTKHQQVQEFKKNVIHRTKWVIKEEYGINLPQRVLAEIFQMTQQNIAVYLKED